MLLRYRGRLPWWGSSGSSVPRSPGATLQRSGAAHGPLHPAVFFSKLCFCVFGLFCRVLESCLGNLKRLGALGLLSCFLSPLSFGPVRLLVFSVLGSQGGGASSQRLLFLGRRGSGGLTDDRMYELFLCYFVFLFSTTSLPIVGAARWACTSSSWLSRTRCFPQAILTCFGFFFLRLAALFWFLSGLVGFPLPRFPSPLPPGVSSLWVRGFPLPCFACVFPVFLGWAGGCVLFLFSCYLLLLASFLARRLGLRKHGLPTRKPPGPHRACT